MAADFRAFEAKGGNYVPVGHAPNLGADPIHFLWQLRHNTENSLFFSLLAGNLASETGSPLTGSSAIGKLQPIELFHISFRKTSLVLPLVLQFDGA